MALTLKKDKIIYYTLLATAGCCLDQNTANKGYLSGCRVGKFFDIKGRSFLEMVIYLVMETCLTA